MRRAREQEGFALIAAVIVMMIVLGLGLALLSYGDAQQRASTRQQSSEAAYALAEAALNAQIFELSVTWPTSQLNAQAAYPSSCNAASAGASFCPNPANSTGDGSFANGYSSSGTCPQSAPTDAWGSTLSNGWTTYVRDDGSSTSGLFSSTTDQSQPAYDFNNDGHLWVRAAASVNCRMVVLVSGASEQLVPLNFPTYALNANGFEISNNGNKTMINSQGTAARSGQVSVRCNGLTGPGAGTTCTSYRSGQVSPASFASPPGASPAIPASQLPGLQTEANANGTYFPAGSCPSSMSALAGAMVYVTGPCNLSFNGGTANSATTPGFLVLINGTLSLNGNANFYGVIYAVNSQGCPTGSNTTCPNGSDVVTVHGNAQVVGGIDVDGSGTVSVGSSGSNGGNLIYSPSEFSLVKTYSGAAATPNTFRVLPQNQ